MPFLDLGDRNSVGLRKVDQAAAFLIDLQEGNPMSRERLGLLLRLADKEFLMRAQTPLFGAEINLERRFDKSIMGAWISEIPDYGLTLSRPFIKTDLDELTGEELELLGLVHERFSDLSVETLTSLLVVGEERTTASSRPAIELFEKRRP